MSLKHLIERSSKNQPPYFISASSNLIELSIPEVTTCAVVIDVAIATLIEGGREGGRGGGGEGGGGGGEGGREGGREERKEGGEEGGREGRKEGGGGRVGEVIN